MVLRKEFVTIELFCPIDRELVAAVVRGGHLVGGGWRRSRRRSKEGLTEVEGEGQEGGQVGVGGGWRRFWRRSKVLAEVEGEGQEGGESKRPPPRWSRGLRQTLGRCWIGTALGGFMEKTSKRMYTSRQEQDNQDKCVGEAKEVWRRRAQMCVWRLRKWQRQRRSVRGKEKMKGIEVKQSRQVNIWRERRLTEVMAKVDFQAKSGYYRSARWLTSIEAEAPAQALAEATPIFAEARGVIRA
ncbi:hypothetical protein R3P38DRAFT_3440736 [Favolaschia claudopus]|uniref:Uncharacterized protein n=1 Tax=Favolaschia claudopus TaxID=2862362 RepID=A0AAW0CWG7_9AGAR